MVIVMPLLIPNIAWNSYLEAVLEHSGHSPTISIDNSTIKLADFAKYIISIDEFQNGTDASVSALETLRNETNPLSHLFFSFLIVSSKVSIFKIMESTDLSVISRKGKISVISGTLFQWRNALISQQKSKETRLIFNQCLSFFAKMGLSNIFDNYRKCVLKDNTFLLEYKND